MQTYSNNGRRIKRKRLFHYVSSLDCMAGVRTLNLTKGCQMGCIYCYIHSYRDPLPLGVTHIFDSILERVETELSRMRIRRIFLSTSSDIMQPILLKKGLTSKILDILSKYRASSTIWTKGSPYLNGDLKYPEILDALKNSPLLFHFEISLGTIKDHIMRKFEPGCARFQDRVHLAERLIELGVNTSARLDPLIPGISDTVNNFNEICKTCYDLGIKDIFYSWLFLRNAIIVNMKSRLGVEFNKIFDHYKNAEKKYLIEKDATKSGVLILPPKDYRMSKIKMFSEIAQSYEINAYPCHCKNADLPIKAVACHLLHKQTKLDDIIDDPY